MKASVPQKIEQDFSTMAIHRIRERWLSNIVHDLSNPLFAARGYVRLALDKRDGALPNVQSRYLAAALENLNKLASLTLELGTFRQIDELECATVSLHELICSMLPEVRTRLAAKNAVLTEDISGASLATLGDAAKLAESVRELLSTAVEFTDPRGTLLIRASEEKENILVEAETTGGSSHASDDIAARLSNVCRIWRLHAGSCSFGLQATGAWTISCELPVIRPQEC